MKVLFIITSADIGTWLSEVTHPYWHLTERGIKVDLASPLGGKVGWTARSDPYYEKSAEADDLVSKGSLSDPVLRAKQDNTKPLKGIELAEYDAVHVAGGRGATFDLYPNEDVARTLEYFWSSGKVVGAICHGAIALANNGKRIRGQNAMGFSLQEDHELENLFEHGFVIPHYPQTSLEEVGAAYTSAGLHAPHVVVDGRLITGQNQQSASEYGIALVHLLTGHNPAERTWKSGAGAGAERTQRRQAGICFALSQSRKRFGYTLTISQACIV
jgi:putative intracellular protease/amidase